MTASRWLLVLLLLVETGCGFHPRGADELPPVMQDTYIAGVAPTSPLGSELRLALETNGARVVTEPRAAGAVLEIVAERSERRVLSVDARGRASEYELRYQLGFRLLGADGAVLVPEDTVTVFRSYRFDPDDVLGKGQEQALLLAEMRRFALRRMLAQLHAAAAAEL